MEECDKCKFFDIKPKEQRGPTIEGHCHRNPPQIHIVGGKYISIWPLINNKDWCGEFKEAGIE